MRHTTLTTADIHAPGGIRTRNLSKRTADDPSLTLGGHRNRVYRNTRFTVKEFSAMTQALHWAATGIGFTETPALR